MGLPTALRFRSGWEGFATQLELVDVMDSDSRKLHCKARARRLSESITSSNSQIAVAKPGWGGGRTRSLYGGTRWPSTRACAVRPRFVMMKHIIPERINARRFVRTDF